MAYPAPSGIGAPIIGARRHPQGASMAPAKSAMSIGLNKTLGILRRMLISNRNFFRSAELIVRKQTELSHGFRKRRIIVVIGYPAPDHYLACSFYASLTTARQMGVAERHPRFPARRVAANIHQQILNAKDGRRIAAFCFLLLLRTMPTQERGLFPGSPRGFRD